jgi:glycosyltransferase involved in cell wall biosynthesis
VRIGLDISPLQNGHRFRGIGSYTRGLLRGFRALDTDDEFRLYYWQSLPLDLDPSVLPRNTRCVEVPYPALGRASALVAQQLLMLPLLARAGLDLMHCPGVVQDPAAGGPSLAWSRRNAVTVHDLTPLVYPNQFLTGKALREFVYRLMLRGVRAAKCVIADSLSTKADLVRLLSIPASRVFVVPLAVDDTFRPAATGAGLAPLPQAIGDAPFLLHVGGDVPNKNVETLLYSFSKLVDRFGVPHALVVVGPEGPRLARFRATRPDLATRVVRVNGLPQSELLALYRKAEVVVFPSTYEGFGLPILEAMACGTPVIASTVSSVPEVAGDAACLVDPYDSEGLTESMMSLLGSEARRKQLSAAGMARAAGFTWERTAAMTLQAYRWALSGAASHSTRTA